MTQTMNGGPPRQRDPGPTIDAPVGTGAMIVSFAVTFASIGAIIISGVLVGWNSLQGVLALCVVAGLLIALLIFDPLLFFLSFSFTATLVPMLASNAYLEFGNYISEQGRFGYATGATSRLAFYCVVVIFAIYIVGRPLINRIKATVTERQVMAFGTWARALHTAALLLGAGILATNGIPLIRGDDRFAYWASMPEIFNRAPFLLAVVTFATVCATVLQKSRTAITWACVLIGLSAIELILLSEKFTGLFQVFVLAVTAAYSTSILHKGSRPRAFRLILLCMTVGVVLLAVAAMGYIVFYRYTFATVGAKIMDRVLGLDGHLWFGVDRLVYAGAEQGPISALFPSFSTDALSGTQQLMYLVSPPDFVDRMIAMGVRFANAGMVIPVWVLGYGWSIVYFMIVAGAAGAVLAYLALCVGKLRLLSMLIAINGVRQLTNVLLAGDPGDLYKGLAIVTWLWIILDVITMSIAARKHRSAFRVRRDDGLVWVSAEIREEIEDILLMIGRSGRTYREIRIDAPIAVINGMSLPEECAGALVVACPYRHSVRISASAKVLGLLAFYYRVWWRRPRVLISGFSMMKHRVVAHLLGVWHVAYIRGVAFDPEVSVGISDAVRGRVLRRFVPEWAVATYHADRVLTIGGVNARFLRGRGVAGEDIRLVGPVWLETVTSNSVKAPGDAVAYFVTGAWEAHGMSDAHEAQLAIVRRLADGWRDERQLGLRVHPRDMYAYEQDPIFTDVLINRDLPAAFLRSLGASDLLITPLSTLAFEAHYLGLSVVYYADVEATAAYNHVYRQLGIEPRSVDEILAGATAPQTAPEHEIFARVNFDAFAGVVEPLSWRSG